MKVYNNILETIGNTPIVRINKLAIGIEAQIFAKIEKELANGQKLHSDSEWSENGFLNWTYSVINNVGSSYTYDFNLDF